MLQTMNNLSVSNANLVHFLTKLVRLAVTSVNQGLIKKILVRQVAVNVMQAPVSHYQVPQTALLVEQGSSLGLQGKYTAILVCQVYLVKLYQDLPYALHALLENFRQILDQRHAPVVNQVNFQDEVLLNALCVQLEPSILM